MRILLGADFHLGATMGWLGGQSAARREDLNRAFSRFVDFALRPDQKIDLVLLLGDIFDTHAPSDALVDLVQRELTRLALADLPVAAIPGTHDGYGYADSVWRSGRFPSSLVLITSPGVSRTTIQAAGRPVHLYGLAFDPARTPADPLLHMRRDETAGPGLHIGMVHGSLPASPEWEFRRRDLAIPTAELAGSGLDLLALGHYHNFLEKWFGDTLATYPGTLEGLKYSESGERSFVTVDLTDVGVAVERSPYPGRRIIDEIFDLDRAGQADLGLVKRLEELAGLDRIVRLTLTGHAPAGFDASVIRSRAANQFFHLDIEDQSLTVDERLASRLASEHTVRGLFVRKMQERLSGGPEADRPLVMAALRAGLAEFGAGEVRDED
ncbi:MAG: DNA repair exonuclease [Candidatus Eisenbacteria bacterium]|nr:DNA repair exonuclease [Candidatus Eisenbacteria bacterium]